MKTLNEHEEFYIRICSVADKIEAKLDKGEQISVEAVADMSKAVSNMMKAEAKTIWGMRRHGNGETL